MVCPEGTDKKAGMANMNAQYSFDGISPSKSEQDLSNVAKEYATSVLPAGDTGEFLRLVSTPQQNQTQPQQNTSSSVSQTTTGSNKPIVIKGGPRRVVRADGQAPKMSTAHSQQKFALSSGHQMFAARKKRHPFLWGLLILAGIAAMLSCFYFGWKAVNSQQDKELAISYYGTTTYDGALSVTPSDDGGYYTVFLVTDNTTNAQHIGALKQVIMYRCDKAMTRALQITVPTDLYVQPKRSNGNAVRTLAQTLASQQSITQTLQGICDAFGIRLYNVICCTVKNFSLIESVYKGTSSASSLRYDDLLGGIRSNLSHENLVSWCTALSKMNKATMGNMVVPTISFDANGSIMQQGSPSSYSNMLNAMLEGYHLDAAGNYLGTQYDENGNPLLDENGLPLGALTDEYGNLIFEDGAVVIWGQQYDQNGYPIGTLYDDWGNAILDWNGNPWGTQYDEWGNPQYDWRGNLVIINE